MSDIVNYAQIRKFDIANGPGVRATLFVSGCRHQCEGCFNEDYKKFNFGQKWTKESQETFLRYINNPHVKGATILGGEPFDQINDDDLLGLVKTIKSQTNKELWMYSGYTFEQICLHPKRFELLKQCDVLVDGPFEMALKDLKLRFRGSSNQRIIDVQSSLRENCVILLAHY